MVRAALLLTISQSLSELITAEAARSGEESALLHAIVEHESHGNPNAVNPTSGAAGLGQIMPSTRPACRGELRDSAGCAEEKQRLLDPAYNLRLVAAGLRQWRQLCKVKTGRTPTVAGLLIGYGGFNRLPRQWCNLRKVAGRWQAVRTPKAVADILKLRKKYERRFSKRRRPKRSAGPGTKTNPSPPTT